MALKLQPPISYLITSGKTTSSPSSDNFSDLLRLIDTAVTAGLSLIQIREKNLTTRSLAELCKQAANLTTGSATRLLVNDRFDVALASGAHGVHLTSKSLNARVVREVCGPDFIIGVSTHSLDEVVDAAAGGAEFAVFGPVFETPSKLSFGEPQGIDKLREVCTKVKDMPVLAIGGVTLGNVEDCFAAGASGVAAIRLFEDPASLAKNTSKIIGHHTL